MSIPGSTDIVIVIVIVAVIVVVNSCHCYCSVPGLDPLDIDNCTYGLYLFYLKSNLMQKANTNPLTH